MIRITGKCPECGEMYQDNQPPVYSEYHGTHVCPGCAHCDCCIELINTCSNYVADQAADAAYEIEREMRLDS